MRGVVRFIHLSDRGMPKDPVPRARVLAGGLEGDRQRNLKYHGGPLRAVSLLALEVIDAIAAEGHPICPGSTGENVTVEGLDWAALGPGDTLAFDGGVQLEITSHVPPCRKIQGSFADGRFGRLSHKSHPGQGRLYARVLVEGEIAVGEGLTARSAS